jgi:two-component system C4-dicarboxylate transport sensor histidine kinase DctB
MNNPLAALQSTLRTSGRLLARSHDDALKAEIAPLHKRCTDASARLARSVEGLRAACRSGSAAPVPRDVVVASEVRAVLALFAHRIGSEIRVDIEGDLEATAWSSADDIHHVFATLLENALHAVRSGGRIRVHIESQGGCTAVAVEDDGPGIPPGAVAHVFEPFFTTKPPGEGTGLGLSMARRVVTKLGGSIAVQEHGALGGAAVHLRLPTREKP